MSMPIEKLLVLLVQKGLLSPAQLDECLRESRSAGRKGTEAELTDILVSRGYVDRETLAGLRSGAEPAPAAAPAPASELPAEVVEARKDPKRVIQKYTLLNEVGRGGMAVVYRAWDDLLKSFVALKLIRSQDVGIGDSAKESEVQEFAREARTALKLSHPNIVRVHELGKHDDRYFLSMEYIDGNNLEKLLHPSRRQSPWQEFYAAPRKFLVILRDVASALDHAHHQKPPIVHRDVKPQNILVDGNGRACVVDFGLAKEMKSGNTITVSGIVKGTPCYMAPEQALGRSGAAGVDARTDLWALGAILYQYLAGVPPFMGPTQREILNKVVTEEPVPPSELHRRRGSGVSVPPELEKICLKALEKEKAARYGSAGEFARELDRYLGGAKVKARGVAGYERVLRKAGRNKTVVLAVSAAVLMTIVAAVALLRPRGPEVAIAKTAPPPAETPPKRPPQESPAPAEAPTETAFEPEELRFRDALIAGLVAEIRKGPRTYAKFSLKDRTLADARLLDATHDALALRVGDRITEIPWSQVGEWQFVFLVNEFRDGLSGDALLGYLAWCLRHSFTTEAVTAARILRGKSMSSAGERLFARYQRKYELDQEPELARKPEPAPAPAPPVPAPPPPPPPVPVRPDPVRKTVPPAAPPAEIRVPEIPAWTYRSDWKDHGPVLAGELVKRGWDDLAEELVLNIVSSPLANDREKDEALLVRTRLWLAQAAREEKPDDAVLKMNWALKTLEGMLGRAVDAEVRAELCSLHSAKGRLLVSSGRTADAMKSFAALEETAKARLADLEKGEGPQPGKEEWLQAKLAPALAMFAEADAFASTVSVGGEAKKSYERLLNHLEGDVLWTVEGTAVGVHANLLRSAARAYLFRPRQNPLSQTPAPPAGVTGWMADPAIARSEAGRWLIPRTILFNVSLSSPDWPPPQADAAATSKWYGEMARYLEEVFRKFPQTKEGEIGQQLSLHLARDYVRSGKTLQAIPILKFLLLPENSGPVKSAAIRILMDAGTPEAKQLVVEQKVPAAASDLPIAAYFYGIVPAGATPWPAPAGFSTRQGLQRDALLNRGGGTAATQASVYHALTWLARHQDADGGWSAEGFRNRCSGGSCGGPGDKDLKGESRPSEPLRITPVFPRRNDCVVPEEEVVSAAPGSGDVGVTGLALLAFLGAGFGPHSKEQGDVVKRGLQWLIRQQDNSGCVGERGGKYMIPHLIAGQALAEAYGLTGWSVLKEPAQKAVDFTIAARNPGRGWRYNERCGDNDTVSTGFAVQQLRAAEGADLTVPKSVYDGALFWFNEATEQNGYFQVGYTARSTGKVYVPGKNEQFDHHAAMTAVAVFGRIQIQKAKADPTLGGVNLLVADLPEWKTNKIDFYYWHYSSLALFAYDGPEGPMWKKWNEPMKNALVPNQKTGKDGCRSGSWDPDQERWGSEGGRVYATAINALTLETYYRFGVPLPVTKKK